MGLLMATAGWGGWTLHTRAQAREKRREEAREAMRVGTALAQQYSQAEAAYSEQRYEDAKRMLLGMLPLAQAKWADDPRLGEIFNELGLVYAAERDYAQAEQYARRGLEIRLKLPLPDSDLAGMRVPNQFRRSG